MRNRFLWNALLFAAAAWANVAVACSPPAGERGTAVDIEVVEAERFPVPPKRSEPLGPGYYPDPLHGGEKS